MIVALIGIVVGLAGVGLAVWQKSRIDQLVQPGGKDLESALQGLKSQLLENKTKQNELEQLVKAYVQKSRAAVQKVGFKKYDAYEDAGGQQSFVAVFLDADNNGVLMNCMHGRQATRLYGKQIKAGKSDSQLSDEEVEVLQSIVNS